MRRQLQANSTYSSELAPKSCTKNSGKNSKAMVQTRLSPKVQAMTSQNRWVTRSHLPDP